MIRVSDHALVRFLERAGGLDVEGMRDHLARSLERAHRAARAIGIDDVEIHADDLVYVVRNATLVTILPRPLRP